MLFPSALMWLVFGAVSAYMARARGRNPYLWFFLGMFFGIFGLVFLFFSPKPAATFSNSTKIKDPNTIDVTPEIDPSYQEYFWYYLDPSNNQNGPMSFDALLRSYKEGKISNKTFVWNEQLDSWKPFSEFI